MRTVTSLPVIEKTVGPQFDPNTGLGNWDAIRSPIDRVIIHTMVGFAQGADERFNDPTSNVSAHYGVLTTGEIWHWVDEDKNAFHAGDRPMNERSIGIEHEDNGQPNSVRPDILYQKSSQLVRDICLFYNIPIDRQHILKHSEVSATQCPDSLDIDKIVSLAQNDAPTCDPNWRIERDDNWNMSQGAVKLLSISVPNNPTSADKVSIGEQMVSLIQALIDYKASHPDVPPVQPNNNTSSQNATLPSSSNDSNKLPTQSNQSNVQIYQTILPNIGQLILNFINWLLHRNEVKQ